MIDDIELINLFRAESEEHLHRLEEGLLCLETNPNDPALLEELFREAHSQKGAAAILGATDIEQVAHRFEDILAGARNGGERISSDLIGRMLQTLTVMRQLVVEAIAGEPARTDLMAVLAPLTVEESGVISLQAVSEDAAIIGPNVVDMSSGEPYFRQSPNGTSDDTQSQVDPVLPSPPSADGLEPVSQVSDPKKDSSPQESVPAIQQQGDTIHTIRVVPEKLDSLLDEVNEVLVTSRQVVNQLQDIEAIADLHESWDREILKYRPMLSDLCDPGSSTEVTRPFMLNDKMLEHHHRLGELIKSLYSRARESGGRLDTVVPEILRTRLRKPPSGLTTTSWSCTISSTTRATLWSRSANTMHVPFRESLTGE